MKEKVPAKVPNIEYKKILYTTDLSESGRYAFHHAASLTNCHRAVLTVLHVVEGGPELDRRLFWYVDEKLWEEIKTQNLQEARDILTQRRRDNAAIKECVGQFCDDIQENMPNQPDVSYSIVVKMGDPVNLIMEESEAGNFDLIVMGFHGHGPVSAAMLGDTVLRVVKRSTIPVLVVASRRMMNDKKGIQGLKESRIRVETIKLYFYFISLESSNPGTLYSVI